MAGARQRGRPPEGGRGPAPLTAESRPGNRRGIQASSCLRSSPSLRFSAASGPCRYFWSGRGPAAPARPGDSPRASMRRARSSSAARTSSAAWCRSRMTGTTAGLHPVHEALDAGFDDGLGLHHGGAARVGAGLHQAAQVVHRIQVDVVQAADFGFDIARHGQVDHDHRAVAAQPRGPLHHPQPEDGQELAVQDTITSNSRGGRSGPTASWCWPRNDWPAARRARPCDWPRPRCAGVARRSEWRRVRSSRRRR